MITVSGLSYAYQNGSTISFPDIQIDEGDHTLILGKSGSGKTTLLHLLSGLRSATSGEIDVLGTPLTGLSQAEIDKFRGKHIGMIFQVPHFVQSLTILENLTLAQVLAGKSKNSQQVNELLTQLNIPDKGNKKSNQLSVGEQQRVAIARALIHSPKIIFADEPTSALDDENTEQVINLLKSQANEYNATLIVVTHDQRLKDNFSNRIVL